jgi:hypothetical protein
MSTTLVAGEHDLRSFAAMVNEERDDLPEEGVSLSLLSDLKNQIPCDYVLFEGYDTKRQKYWFAQQVPDDEEDPDTPSDQRLHRALWEHFWDCKFCSYPDRTGTCQAK